MTTAAGPVSTGLYQRRSAFDAGYFARCAARGLARPEAPADFLHGKLQSARFYGEHLLPQVRGLAMIVASGGASVVEADPALL